MEGFEEKIPFYKVYGEYLPEFDEKQGDRDLDYLISLYPAATKRLLPLVWEVCDQKEYEGSFLYDAYPDAVQLYEMGRKLYEMGKATEKEEGEWLKDLVFVLLYQEIYRRRKDRRQQERREPF